MPVEPTNDQNFARWVKVFDRAASDEMPPAASDLAAFTNSLAAILLKTDRERIDAEGRATQRRLNRYEYEDTLGDLLLLPYLEVKSFLPEASEANGFNKCGDALDVSHVLNCVVLPRAASCTGRKSSASKLNACSMSALQPFCCRFSELLAGPQAHRRYRARHRALPGLSIGRPAG